MGFRQNKNMEIRKLKKHRSMNLSRQTLEIRQLCPATTTQVSFQIQEHLRKQEQPMILILKMKVSDHSVISNSNKMKRTMKWTILKQILIV